ncbi:EGF-like and EMI domain-containing protein 1 [Salvelinus sp. IW2-2015]|uniref:EGF-like and EMI domain-containing protein 1 n=1 Tax=Salvelinus sp. IW2-2015 TaxID=2691554 RepID=UPI000CDF9523|nr:EGF-like and EMI domain-containing protein 1 [Salvelinus alpinus]
MFLNVLMWCMIALDTARIASSLELQPDMPNVCAEQELSMLGARQPCVQAFTRMVKVWKQGCTGHRWCVGYERRTGYYTAYRQVYSMDVHRVYRCCPGWTQRGKERGCLHRVCAATTCFNGGRCAERGDQICQCPVGFQGTRCQYAEL